jgi:hypothetical protein
MLLPSLRPKLMALGQAESSKELVFQLAGGDVVSLQRKSSGLVGTPLKTPMKAAGPPLSLPSMAMTSPEKTLALRL